MRRKLRWLAVFFADLRFGIRMLKRNRGVAIVGVLTLALGVGANTAIFSLLYAVLLRPLPYRDPGRLVWASQYAPRLDATLVRAGTFLTWRDQNRSFEDMAAYDDHLCDGNLTMSAEPVRLDRCAEVSANFFSLLYASHLCQSARGESRFQSTKCADRSNHADGSNIP
jgi:hypothetical protein